MAKKLTRGNAWGRRIFDLTLFAAIYPPWRYHYPMNLQYSFGSLSIWKPRGSSYCSLLSLKPVRYSTRKRCHPFTQCLMAVADRGDVISSDSHEIV